jgi:hypothetical protein
MKYLGIIMAVFTLGCNPESRQSHHVEYFHKSTSAFSGSGSLYDDVVADSLYTAFHAKEFPAEVDH